MSRRIKMSKEELVPGLRSRDYGETFEARVAEATKLLKEFPELSVKALAEKMGVTLNQMQWYCRTLKKRNVLMKKVRVVDDGGETDGRKETGKKSGK